MSQEGYRKTYALRRPVLGKNSLEVTFPYDVAERHARQLGLTIDQLLDQCALQVEFNDSPIVTYTIIEKAAAV